MYTKPSFFERLYTFNILQSFNLVFFQPRTFLYDLICQQQKVNVSEGKIGLAKNETAGIMVAIETKAVKERVGGARPQESTRLVEGCGKRH